MDIKAKREELLKTLEQFKTQAAAIQGYLAALDDMEKPDVPVAPAKDENA